MVQQGEVTMDWLLKALGADVEEVDAIPAWSLRWGAESWMVGVLVAGVALALFGWWAYRLSPQEVGSGRRAGLALLRVAFLAGVLALLLQPVLVLTLEREVPRSLPVLVDTTGSMGMTDGQGETRMESVVTLLAERGGREVLDRLSDDLEVPVYEFGERGLRPMRGDWSGLSPSGGETALGGALVNALERYRGVPMAGMVVITDGGQNKGIPMLDARDRLVAAGVPVVAVGVGDEGARDVAVEEVEVRDVLLADDAAPVRVRLRAQGLRGERGRVTLLLAGVEVAEEPVVFGGDGLQEVEAMITPRQPGDYVLEARFEGEALGESLAENNEARATLRVVDRRLRVLVVDQAPRWEYKYLEAMLLRERRVELSTVLFEADAEVARVPGSPYLERFPERAEDLFGFDLVVLGDIDPKLLTDELQALLGDYVARAGGALVVLAGKRFLPGAYQQSTLARLLPVELAGGTFAEGAANQAVRVELTEAGRESVMLRLSDDVAANGELWARLPPIYWAARVGSGKPAADVLLARPDPSGARDEIPVMAIHRYGAGEVLFVGTDNFWRYRRNAGDRYHVTLWGQIIQRMAGKRLLDETPRARLQVEQRHYGPGDRVRVYAKLFNRSWEPLLEESVPGVLVGSADPDERQDVVLRSVPGQPGSYRGELVAGAPGNYRLALAGDEVARLDFTVRDTTRERSRADLNGDLLRELAEQTGGAYLPLAEFARLPEVLDARRAVQRSSMEVDLWTSPLVFAILVVLITIEWIVRKLSELK